MRSYSGQGLTSSDRRILEAAMAASGSCPFGTRPRFALVEPESVGDVASGRIGTYGIIKDAPAFIVGAASKVPFACADFGFALEGIVLVAAANGLGTCWLGGTFNRSGANEVLHLTVDEVVPAVTPVGDPADHRTMVDTAMRAFAGSKKRRPWSELFFNRNWNTPLTEEESGIWNPVLEAVRRGPSASNKQPWRIVHTGSGQDTVFHLFLYEDKAYNTAIRGVRIQEIDIGIAMRHFEAASRALNLPGHWSRLGEVPVNFGEPYVYYSSWIVG